MQCLVCLRSGLTIILHECIIGRNRHLWSWIEDEMAENDSLSSRPDSYPPYQYDALKPNEEIRLIEVVSGEHDPVCIKFHF